MTETIIEEVTGALPELAETLRAAALPVDDLTLPGRHFFRFRATGRPLIGFIGWEATGRVALLRSLVVVPECRGQGWSRAMTGWALLRLAEAGVTDAWVLTTTIAPLAEKLGFHRVERALVPAEIQASRQFAALCPSNAILMHRSLP